MSVHSIAQFIPLNAVTIAANVRTSTGLDQASLSELAESIKTHGLLQAVIKGPQQVTADGPEPPRFAQGDRRQSPDYPGAIWLMSRDSAAGN